MTASYEKEVRTALEKYTFAKEAMKEVMTVWPDFHDLQPVTKNNLSSDGRELGLEGAVTMKYKGQSYNIPISVWFPDAFPVESPRVLVKPQADMVINKAARYYVGVDGTLTLPYLQEWNYPESNLYDLLAVLCVGFGECPPVGRPVPPDTHQTEIMDIPISDFRQTMPVLSPTVRTSSPRPVNPSTKQTCTTCDQLERVQAKQEEEIETLRRELQLLKQEIQQIKTEMQQMTTGRVLNSSDDFVD